LFAAQNLKVVYLQQAAQYPPISNRDITIRKRVFLHLPLRNHAAAEAARELLPASEHIRQACLQLRTLGIVPLLSETEGVENKAFNNCPIGASTSQLRQSNHTFQWLDNFSRVVRTQWRALHCNTSLFSLQPLGQPGNAERRFFWPGPR
jgi:hypothetical protein